MSLIETDRQKSVKNALVVNLQTYLLQGLAHRLYMNLGSDKQSGYHDERQQRRSPKTTRVAEKANVNVNVNKGSAVHCLINTNQSIV